MTKYQRNLPSCNSNRVWLDFPWTCFGHKSNGYTFFQFTWKIVILFRVTNIWIIEFNLNCTCFICQHNPFISLLVVSTLIVSMTLAPRHTFNYLGRFLVLFKVTSTLIVGIYKIPVFRSFLEFVHWLYKFQSQD